MKQLRLIFGAILAVGAMSARADIIEIFDTASWTLNNQVSADWQQAIGSTRNNSNVANVFLDGFDSSLGTLLGVSLDFTSQWNLTHEVRGEDRTGGWLGEENIYAYGNANQALIVDLFDPLGSTMTLNKSQAASCSDNDGACSQNTGGGGNFNGNLTFLSISDLIDAVSVQLVLRNTITGTSHVDDYDDWHKFVARNSWGGSATITYRYDNASTQIPEPGTLALFGIGLVGMGLARRKTR